VDQELFLHRALLAAPVAVVVDRGPTALDACLKRSDDSVAQSLVVLGFIEPAGESGCRRARKSASSA
jgi:hypothetical protein